MSVNLNVHILAYIIKNLNSIYIFASYYIRVVTASLEAKISRVKLDVAFFGWVWLIVESGNILCVRKLLRAKSSAPEVKNERVKAFACELFYLLSCLYLLLLSFFSCHLRIIGPFNYGELLPGNNILHIFILHAQVIKMGITPSSHN